MEELNLSYQKSDPGEDHLSRLYEWDKYDADVQVGPTEWQTVTEVLQECKGMDHPNKQRLKARTRSAEERWARNAYLVP